MPSQPMFGIKGIEITAESDMTVNHSHHLPRFAKIYMLFH
jgi:hypothetical protein